MLDMNTDLAYPSCSLTLSETDSNVVNLSLTVTTWIWYRQSENFSTWLSIDAQDPEKLDSDVFYSNSTGMFGSRNSRQYSVALAGLEEGVHFMKVRVEGDYYTGSVADYAFEGNASFLVDNKFPVICDISIKNATYYENSLELSCKVSEQCMWVAYSLNGAAKVNFTDNDATTFLQAKTNLTSLAEGTYFLAIYASDMAGNVGASQTIRFNVDTSMPYLVALIVAGVIAVVLAVVGVLLIARRRRS